MVDDFHIESVGPPRNGSGHAIRVTHVKTNLTATCDTERTPFLNMRKAMRDVEHQLSSHYGHLAYSSEPAPCKANGRKEGE